MKPSTSLFGASRLLLTPKRANKDYYKGTRQSYVPGGGHRTGPPGKHVVQGKAKYQVLDERVRYFVGPGKTALETTNLKPYVSTKIERRLPSQTPSSSSSDLLPSFSPNARPSLSNQDGQPLFSPSDFTAFSRRYQRATTAEKQALIMQSRREWWGALQGRYSQSSPLGDGEVQGVQEAQSTGSST